MRKTVSTISWWLFGTLALSVVTPGCGGKKTLDVEKLPCAERRPASGSHGAFIQCTNPSADIDVGGGLVCRKGSTLGVYTKTKTVYECWVTKPSTVDGVSCTGGVSLFADGKLRRCQLAADLSRSGLTLPKGSWITFTEGGDLRRLELPTPTQVGPVSCKGYMNFVYPSGKPNRCELAQPTVLDGQQKKASEVVCLDEAGKLADCSKYSFSAL
jgi:hypothetical protein